MGKGIKRKGNSNQAIARISIRDVIVPIELDAKEMLSAKIGQELPLINATGITDGDYVEFSIVYDSATQLMVADKAQKVPGIKSTFLNKQTINEITVNPNEAVLISESTVTDKIVLNGGFVVIESSSIQKIKDDNASSSLSVVLFSSTVNENIKIDNAANVTFVAHDCTFNDNVSFSKNDPVILCADNCRFKKLSVK